MIEREFQPHLEQSTASQIWEFDVVAETLGAAVEPSRDVAFGAGARFQLAGETAPTLELYPASGVARLTTHAAEVTLFRQSPPGIDPEHGHVCLVNDSDAERLQLMIAKTGEVTLCIAPAALGHATKDVADPEGAEMLLGPDRGIPGHSSVASGPPEESFSGSERQQREAQLREQESTSARLNLSGRLGRAPSFRTTRNGTLIASFPLAVRDDDGNTTWHTILTFGNRAEKLRDQLDKGQSVQVIGYQHEREVRTKRGETKLVTEVYATVVKPR